MNELPTFTCWRCDSECDTTWVDVSRMDGTGPEVIIQGATRCTNERCSGAFDQAADRPPSPEQLERRGREALARVRQIAAEVHAE